MCTCALDHRECRFESANRGSAITALNAPGASARSSDARNSHNGEVLDPGPVVVQGELHACRHHVSIGATNSNAA